MDNKQIKKLTLADFIARKTQRENDKTAIKEIYIESMGGNATLIKLKTEEVIDLMDKVNENTGLKEQMQISKELIYNSMPILKNPELQSSYELIEPWDIVEELFDYVEIMKIGQEILKMYGLSEINQEIKN